MSTSAGKYSRRLGTAVLPQIEHTRTLAGDDTDTATRQTIEQMCYLIRGAIADEEVRRVAEHIRRRLTCNSSSPAAICWGVFWWVKHSIKFRTDEGTMFRVGRPNEQDLLISPTVLVRMKDPAEDCDGFTMVTAALLAILGVPALIATVAADLDDPTRWSHVFVCAIVDGKLCPLDTSHGSGPGWMVPRHRINRWQTWSLDGKPTDAPIPQRQGLQGYRRTGIGAYARSHFPLVLVPTRGKGFSGLGQAGCWCDDGSDASSGVCDDGSTPDCGSSGGCTGTPATPGCSTSTCIVSDPTCGLCTAYDDSSCSNTINQYAALTSVGDCAANTTFNGLTCVPAAGAPAGTVGATPNYAALLSSLSNAAGSDLKAVIQQPQALLSAQTWANLSAYLPILGVGALGVFLIVSLAGKK